MPNIRRFRAAHGPLLGVAASIVAAACSSSTGSSPPTVPVIYFDAVSQGNRDVYSVSLDGSNLHRITTDPADDLHPAVHGGVIYFVSFRTGKGAIFTVPTAGGSETELIGGTYTALDLAVSKTATVAYSSDADVLPKIWVMGTSCPSGCRFEPADSGFSGAIEAGPAWSPDGTRIVYTTTRDGNAGLYVGTLGADTGSATALLSGDGNSNVEPSWSPDGKQVVFTSDRDTLTHQSDLYLLTVATRDVKRLTTIGNVGQPSYLASGQVVFTEFSNGGPSQLAWLDPTSPSTIHPITTSGMSSENGTGER